MALDRRMPPGLAARLFPPGSPRALLLCRAAWPQSVGAELSRRTEVLALEGRTLRIRVPDARWRSVLHRMRREILERLFATLGEVAPNRLSFTEGGIVEPPAPGPETRAQSQAAEPPPSLLPHAGAIFDPEIRAKFLETAGRYLERSRRNA